jgi:tRNA dimethylallyltransferase
MTALPERPQPAIAIVGPTASGKSDVAMAWCAGQPGQREILAVDAMQVYRGMDIGTGKPTAADQATVVHHGLDLVDPDEEFTVADYLTAVQPCRSRAARQVMVAGTGLYLRHLIDPMDLPGQYPEVRTELEHRVKVEGLARLYDQLHSLDPVAAVRMESSNERRVVRALEVCLGAGRPFSSFGPGLDQYPSTATEQIGLRWPRDVLTTRIRRRVMAMVDAGFIDEVRELMRTDLSRTARQALGYRELIAALSSNSSISEAVELTVLRTRQYAVRQERWFRRDPRIRWVDIGDDPVADVLPVMERLCPD